MRRGPWVLPQHFVRTHRQAKKTQTTHTHTLIEHYPFLLPQHSQQLPLSSTNTHTHTRTHTHWCFMSTSDRYNAFPSSTTLTLTIPNTGLVLILTLTLVLSELTPNKSLNLKISPTQFGDVPIPALTQKNPSNTHTLTHRVLLNIYSVFTTSDRPFFSVLFYLLDPTGH